MKRIKKPRKKRWEPEPLDLGELLELPEIMLEPVEINLDWLAPPAPRRMILGQGKDLNEYYLSMREGKGQIKNDEKQKD